MGREQASRFYRFRILIRILRMRKFGGEAALDSPFDWSVYLGAVPAPSLLSC